MVCLWLMLRVAALASLGADWEGKGSLLCPAIPGALMVSEGLVALLTLQLPAPAR